MKKISLILLILIYTSSTFGMVVKEFYCCGKLTSVSFSLENDSKVKNGKQVNLPDCCKTKAFSSKVKDNHTPSFAVVSPVKYFTQIEPHFSALKVVPLANSEFDFTSGAHDPPLLHSSTPIYIFIRVIRI
ncbi:MAG TPA: hypothetical protein VK559_09860 [Ferruginibacter sp.]|nr:hypothetical protein [Ferruginibacter sp.]